MKLSEETHTYSIVARDLTSGQLGVAVQSHAFGVGRIVSWAEPGVGAVATQALSEQSYGPLGLQLMRASRSAEQSLAALLAADPGRELRQVGMIAAYGPATAHTGRQCIPAAGHWLGEHYAAQANMMRRDTVWRAMSRAFESAAGDLAERLLAALDAAQAEGGDVRGMQSAALLVVGGQAGDPPWSGRLFDLRVDDHEDPLGELRRLVGAARASQHGRRALDLLRAPGVDSQRIQQARAEFAIAEQNLEALRGNLEPMFWFAVGLAGAGLLDEATRYFRQVFAADSCWRELIPTLPAAGRLPLDDVLITRIVSL
jgi:uncharacterized Ntn-hydrolase superfamily protein